MKIEDALKLAIDNLVTWKNWCQVTNNVVEFKKLEKAISVLRDGEEPVEGVVVEIGARKCQTCGRIFVASGQRCNCPWLEPSAKIRATKTYTTTLRLTIETVESDPVFEEIDDE